MLTSITRAALLLAIAISVTTPTFAQMPIPTTGATTTSSTMKVRETREVKADRAGKEKSSKENRTDGASKDRACVGAAVAVREKALQTAMGTYTTAMINAYTARGTELASAYALAIASEGNGAVKTSWKTFDASLKKARAEWQGARKAAWGTFTTAAKACKAPVGTSDSANVKSEI